MSETASEAVARRRLREEIRRIVDKASASGQTLRASYFAAILFADYPGANFSVDRITNELLAAAAAAKASTPSPLSTYLFELLGPRAEELGPMDLQSDPQAIEFATVTIHYITREGDDYAGCTLRISQDGRTVAELPVIAPT